MGGIEILLVDTIGRKTGRVRTVALACYPYGDDVAVVASNNGSDRDPVWWLNLQAQPVVNVQRGRRRCEAKAERLSVDEKEAFWPEIIASNPRQANYRERSSRDLPVIVFRLAEPAA